MPRTAPFLIEPRVHDIGNLSVRRLLPHVDCRRLGSFVFFDHIGPADLPAGQGIDVRPHPHIGLATVTYLDEGAIGHSDSLGYEQVIRPGDVNWMTAGRGIVHSERTPPAERAAGHRVHGIQTWVALPREHEETAPAFRHHPAATLPEVVLDGGRAILRVVAGRAYGQESPVEVFSETLYVAVQAEAGARIPVDANHAERGIYVAEGSLRCAGVDVGAGQLLVLPETAELVIEVPEPCRAFLFGGAALDGDRHLWWNFVSSSRDRIDQAKRDWAAQRMGQVPGESEFIPLPEY